MDEYQDIINKKNITDIKSSFILKIIFSFSNEKLKLNLIIYNKEFQKIFLVDIGDYKKKW